MSAQSSPGTDWSKIPAPEDDGGCDHLSGARLPSVALTATDGEKVDLSALGGTVVVFAFPRTGEPGKPSLVDNWESIPGARGCTPQTCGFRDLYSAMREAGADHIYGRSTQDTGYQRAAVARLNLPYPLLSDEHLELATAMRLPVLEVAGHRLIKRLAFIARDGVIQAIFYPVFPPDQNANLVLDWLDGKGRAG